MALTAEDLEFRYHQLRETLGVEPKLPITVWEFPSAEVKKALVGAGDTLYAKPWTREIFVQTDRFPSRRAAARDGARVRGDVRRSASSGSRWRGAGTARCRCRRWPVGLIEGVAEAADASDPDEDATIHEQARGDDRGRPGAAAGRVVGAGFSTLAGARAYTIAGSFSAFLLATRGAERLRALYRSAGNFSDVYRVAARRPRDASGASSSRSSR